jgi:hypothetical protein
MKKLIHYCLNAVFLSGILAFAEPAAAQSDAELVGKFLEEDNSAGIGALVEGMSSGGENVSDQDAIAGLFGSLIGGSKFESIKVEIAEPGRLVLLVKYRKFKNYELVVRAIGLNGQSVDAYVPPINIDPGNKQGMLNVELVMPSAGQNRLKTTHIRFEARPRYGQGGSAWTYQLNKDWGVGANVVGESGSVASGSSAPSGSSGSSGPSGNSGGGGQEPPPFQGSFPGQSSDYVGRVIPVTLVGVNEETINLRKSENSTTKAIPRTRAFNTSSTAVGMRSTRVTMKSSASKTAMTGHLATGTLNAQVYAQHATVITPDEQWLDTKGCVVTKSNTGKKTDCGGAAKAAYKKKPGAEYLSANGCVVTILRSTSWTNIQPKKRSDCRKSAKDAYLQKTLFRSMQLQTAQIYVPTNTPKDKTPRGPTEAIVPLLGDAVVSVSGMRPEDIIPLHYNIYQDANPDSGVFYYLPRAYHLKWDTDRGHGLDINLGAQGGSAGNDTVSINAILDSGIGLEDAIIAKTLAEAYIKRNSTGILLTQLRPLTVNAVPTTSLKADLQVNSIEANNISVNPGTDIFSDMSVAWTSDAVTKANIYQLLRNDNGISSQLTFQVGEAESGAVVTIPTSIALANSKTFGQIPFDRDKGWKNEIPYPVKLKYVHALILEDRLPVVYSWDLGDTILQPKDSVQWNAGNVPAWVDQKALRLWTEYYVDNTCDPCSQLVLEDIEQGVIIRTHQILIDPMNTLDRLGAYEIGVQIRSRYINPSPSQSPEYLPWARLRENGEEVNVGMLHLGDRSLGEEVPGDPLMAYRVVVIMDGTGERHEGQNWIPLNDTRLILGTSQVEASLGYLPE